MAIIRWNKGALGKRRHAFLGFAGSGFLHGYTSVRTETLLAGAVFATSFLTASLTVVQGVEFATRTSHAFVKLTKPRVFVKLPKVRDLKMSA